LEGKLEVSPEHDPDVARVIASLAAAGKTPVVVGESDFDRDAIARGVALKIASGNVPDSLRGKRVFRLRLDALAKGAKTSEEFVSRVQAVFAEASQTADQIVLFVDQLHQYAGTRAASTASAAVKGDSSEPPANHRRRVPGGLCHLYWWRRKRRQVARINLNRLRADTATTRRAQTSDAARSTRNSLVKTFRPTCPNC
jgi:hypothetical protein